MTVVAIGFWVLAGFAFLITAVGGTRTGTGWIVTLALLLAGLFAWVFR